MENASKALIMAAEVMVGIMIISIGVYIFNLMGSYSAETTQDMETVQIDQFNEQFMKYYGTITTFNDVGEVEYHGPRPCTIHDIVGLANLAKKNNVTNGYIDVVENHPEDNPSETSSYIQISMFSETSGKIENVESLSEDELVNLIKTNDTTITENTADIKYFECTSYHIGGITKTVNYMSFREIQYEEDEETT